MRYRNRFVSYMQWLCSISRAPSANGSERPERERERGMRTAAGVGDEEKRTNRRLSTVALITAVCVQCCSHSLGKRRYIAVDLLMHFALSNSPPRPPADHLHSVCSRATRGGGGAKKKKKGIREFGRICCSVSTFPLNSSKTMTFFSF